MSKDKNTIMVSLDSQLLIAQLASKYSRTLSHVSPMLRGSMLVAYNRGALDLALKLAEQEEEKKKKENTTEATKQVEEKV